MLKGQGRGAGGEEKNTAQMRQRTEGDKEFRNGNMQEDEEEICMSVIICPSVVLSADRFFGNSLLSVDDLLWAPEPRERERLFGPFDRETLFRVCSGMQLDFGRGWPCF